MKNSLIIDENGVLQMASSIDDGTNSFYINDDEIPELYWIGTGGYIFTIGNVTYTIMKAPNSTGNYQLIKDSETEFHFARAYSKREELMNLIYPVGSIYMSVNAVDPSTLFGGTWEKIKDVFLLASGDDYSIGATGGEAEVTLTAAQSGLPSHNHGPSTTDASFLITEGDALTRHTVASGSGAVNMVRSPSAVLRNSNTSSTSQDASQSHENMPPYLAVNVWKRTAL